MATAMGIRMVLAQPPSLLQTSPPPPPPPPPHPQLSQQLSQQEGLMQWPEGRKGSQCTCEPSSQPGRRMNRQNG
jgi:hypothetical protein